jgi:membrane fusion protein (multidrug efflux system)
MNVLIPRISFVCFHRAGGPVLLLALALALAAGCGRSSPTAGMGGGPGGGPGGALPPAEAGVVTITPQKAALTTELPGRINAERVAEVCARATGIVLKRRFDEGAEVQADQVLFEIDPAPLQASYDSAKASLAKAEATLAQARNTAQRNETLVKINGVSRQTFEDAKAAVLEDEADVLVDKAALETASLNLGYTKVTAPIAGRIGKALVTEGALASASDATKLAVIQQLDPIYVDFTQSSAEQLKLRRALESGKLQGISEKEVRITLLLEDGSTYRETGRLVFTDISVDENTGSVTLRGEFPNPQKLLLPGMFVRGRVETGTAASVITVPQRAVARDAAGQASVFIVNAQNQVEQRDIQTGATAGDQWVVSDGLKGGERVAVEGLQKVRAGATVNPVPLNSGGAGTAAVPPLSHE